MQSFHAKTHCFRSGSFSGFAYKFFAALRAFDGDLSLVPGYPDALAALGAIEIPMFPILKPLQKQQKTTVFPVALVGIAGEAPENGPEHETVGNKGQDQLHQCRRDKQGHKAHHNACAQNAGIQFVGAVAAHHKVAKSFAHFDAQITQPLLESIHEVYHLAFLFTGYIILQKAGISTVRKQCLRIV